MKTQPLSNIPKQINSDNSSVCENNKSLPASKLFCAESQLNNYLNKIEEIHKIQSEYKDQDEIKESISLIWFCGGKLNNNIPPKYLKALDSFLTHNTRKIYLLIDHDTFIKNSKTLLEKVSNKFLEIKFVNELEFSDEEIKKAHKFYLWQALAGTPAAASDFYRLAFNAVLPPNIKSNLYLDFDDMKLFVDQEIDMNKYFNNANNNSNTVTQLSPDNNSRLMFSLEKDRIEWIKQCINFIDSVEHLQQNSGIALSQMLYSKNNVPIDITEKIIIQGGPRLINKLASKGDDELQLVCDGNWVDKNGIAAFRLYSDIENKLKRDYNTTLHPILTKISNFIGRCNEVIHIKKNNKELLFLEWVKQYSKDLQSYKNNLNNLSKEVLCPILRSSLDELESAITKLKDSANKSSEVFHSNFLSLIKSFNSTLLDLIPGLHLYNDLIIRNIESITAYINKIKELASVGKLTGQEIRVLLLAQHQPNGVPGLYKALQNGHADSITAYINGIKELASADKLTSEQIVELLLTKYQARNVTGLFIALANGHANSITVYINGIKELVSAGKLKNKDIEKLLTAQNDNYAGLAIALQNGHTDSITAYIKGIQELASANKLTDKQVKKLLSSSYVPGLSQALQSGHTDSIAVYIKGIKELASVGKLSDEYITYLSALHF